MSPEPLTLGQPITDNAVLAAEADKLAADEKAPEKSAPETTETGSQPSPPPDLAPKYQGRTVEELAKMHRELEGKLGEQGRELGEIKNQYQQSLWQLQQFQQQVAQQIQRPQTPPPPTPASDAWSWDNPGQSVDSRVDTRLEKRLNEAMGQFQRQQALSVGELAFDSAKGRRKDLFEGVENEVRGLVQQGVLNGWLAPDSVTKPETYLMAAWQMQGLKKGFAMTPTPTNAVQPSFSETPSGARPPADSGEPVVLDDLARGMIKGMGYKEEDIAKEMRERSRGRR